MNLHIVYGWSQSSICRPTGSEVDTSTVSYPQLVAVLYSPHLHFKANGMLPHLDGFTVKGIGASCSIGGKL